METFSLFQRDNRRRWTIGPAILFPGPVDFSHEPLLFLPNATAGKAQLVLKDTQQHMHQLTDGGSATCPDGISALFVTAAYAREFKYRMILAPVTTLPVFVMTMYQGGKILGWGVVRGSEKQLLREAVLTASRELNPDEFRIYSFQTNPHQDEFCNIRGHEDRGYTAQELAGMPMLFTSVRLIPKLEQMVIAVALAT